VALADSNRKIRISKNHQDRPV
jgi:ubiquinone/menaquinone biosynthesis C-methylase UbiE